MKLHPTVNQLRLITLYNYRIYRIGFLKDQFDRMMTIRINRLNSMISFTVDWPVSIFLYSCWAPPKLFVGPCAELRGAAMGRKRRIRAAAVVVVVAVKVGQRVQAIFEDGKWVGPCWS